MHLFQQEFYIHLIWNQKAIDLKQALEKSGLNVNMKSENKLGHDHIAIHNLDLPTEVLVGLKKNIPDIKINKQFMTLSA